MTKANVYVGSSNPVTGSHDGDAGWSVHVLSTGLSADDASFLHLVFCLLLVLVVVTCCTFVLVSAQPLRSDG